MTPIRQGEGPGDVLLSYIEEPEQVPLEFETELVGYYGRNTCALVFDRLIP